MRWAGRGGAQVKGTALQKALDARARILAVLEPCVQASRKHMEAGGEPRCALDFWQRDVLDNKADKPDDYKEIADAMLDMLFAAQDATTSSVVWTIYTLHKFPKVVEKVRQAGEAGAPQGHGQRQGQGHARGTSRLSASHQGTASLTLTYPIFLLTSFPACPPARRSARRWRR